MSFRYYFPLELRELTEFTTPLGPSFSRAKTVEMVMDEEILQLKLPPHSPVRREYQEFPAIRSIDLDRAGVYNENYHLDGWKDGYVLSRFWRFVGPWFTGSVASLHIAVCVSKLVKPEESLLRPACFERAVIDRINQTYGKDELQGKPDWVPPTEWKVVESFPVLCLIYSVLPTRGGDPVLDCTFPVRSDVLVTIRFDQHQLLTGTLEKKDALIDRSSMIALASKIIESMELSASEVLKAQIESIKLNKSNAPLNSKPPAFDWPLG